ncbi:MAG: tetratricopeptide repeat protein [Cyanobacteriota bacterium]|nr:tetratricopeptide repeat protein [Cyanobacteriota bacterium]
MPQEKNDYDILRVSPQATIEEIKAAFRKLARQYHPDLHPNNPQAEAEFKRICEAYETLSDLARRGLSDRLGTPKTRKTELNPYDFYVRGAQKLLEKDYRGAIDQYNQAIRLNPRFVEAFLKRAEVRYKLGDDRGTLEDCRQVLEIDPDDPDAHYYQGRARYRLGYSQSALEAYGRALSFDPQNARAYYYRGIAHNDLNNEAAALRDWQKAAEVFEATGDLSGYKLAKDTLRRLKKRRLRWGETLLGDWVARMNRVLGLTLSGLGAAANPGGSLLSVYLRLERGEAAAVGIILAAIANFNLIIGAFWGWRDLFRFSGFDLMLVGWVPFACLVAVSAIARLCFHRPGHWAGDIFLAGTTLFPIGLLALASAVSPYWGLATAMTLAVFACCYAILIFYNGCIQINHLPEAAAAIATPFTFLLCSWLTYWTFIAFFP